MKRFILLLAFTIIASCAKPPIRVGKEAPEFTKTVVSPEVQVIQNEFFALSAQNDIYFTDNVTIGFAPIERERTIGSCTYGGDWREITLDTPYWTNANWATKVALVYHEMAHCFCTRDHDFDDGEMYPDNSLKYILQRLLPKYLFAPMKVPGYMEDYCPKSIMHPIVLSNECFEKHYSHYVKEMFNRCNPW